MNILEYAKNINEYNQRHKTTLAHGMEWKKHKYIRKEGDRYIYPEDLNANKVFTSRYGNALNTASNAKIEKQKQEAIAKNANAAQLGEASRYANTPSAQKKQAEAIAKNAAAARYTSDYNALKEQAKSVNAAGVHGPNNESWKKASATYGKMAVNNPKAAINAETNSRITGNANSVAEESIRSGYGDAIKKHGWGVDTSEAVKKNAAAAQNGGDAARYANKPEAKSTAKPVNTKEYIAKKAVTTYADGLSTLNKMLDEYKKKYKNKEFDRANFEDKKERDKIVDYANTVLRELDKLDPYKAIDFTREARSRIESIGDYNKWYEGLSADIGSFNNAGLGSNYNANDEKMKNVQKNAAAARYGGEAARYAKTTSKSEPEVSDEYKQDVEYNSKKNVYFGKQSKPTVSGSNSVTTWDNANVTTWDDVDSEYEKEKKYNSQKNRW